MLFGINAPYIYKFEPVYRGCTTLWEICYRGCMTLRGSGRDGIDVTNKAAAPTSAADICCRL